MKRSEINAIIRDADAFIKQCGFHLPPFADWTSEEWSTKGPDVRSIADLHLGWDITDFGLERYAQTGLLLFTIRNGMPDLARAGWGKTYAEKILVVDVDQVTPLHFHWNKMEDIINRGGGMLAIQLYNATLDDKLAPEDVIVMVDSAVRRVKAGETLLLAPGESITLVQRCYHAFWGVESRVLVGEVSMVNDDASDNCFYEPVGRFPIIEEDEPPFRLLVNDYERYYQP